MERVPTDHEGLERYAKAVFEREASAREHQARHKEIWGDGPPYFSLGSYAFWSELSLDRFTLARCGSCQHVYFPPRVVCPQCWAQDAVQVQVTPARGALVSFSDLHVTSPVLKPLAPLRMALVDLEEGVRVLTWLRGPGANEAQVGQACKIVVEEVLGRKWFVANLAA